MVLSIEPYMSPRAETNRYNNDLDHKIVRGYTGLDSCKVFLVSIDTLARKRINKCLHKICL
jgi:hypothetical protein